MSESAFIIAMIVLFIHGVTWEGMLLDFVRYRLHRLPEWLKMPLFDCPICMTPWWGSFILALWCLRSAQWVEWQEWVTVILTAGGINVLAASILGYVRDQWTEGTN